jgi:hypothetical protein
MVGAGVYESSMNIRIPAQNALDISVEIYTIRITVAAERVSGFPSAGETTHINLDPDTMRVRDWKGGVGRISVDIFNKCLITLVGVGGLARDVRLTDKVPAFIPSTYTDFIEFEVRPDGSIPGWVWDDEALAALTEWLSD